MSSLPRSALHCLKGDTTFDLWKYEVQCLLLEATHPQGVIVHAIWKSLKGEAGKIAMRLGANAEVTKLLEKLEGVYGTVERGESLLADFYSAQQGVDESVVTWGCKLEDMLDKAKQKGHVTSAGMDEMLRTKFWLGMQPQLKDKSRHLFDKCKSFDDIRVQLRIIEHEQKLQQGVNIDKQTTKTGQVKNMTTGAATTNVSSVGEDKGMTELKGMVHQLATTVQGLQQEVVKLAGRGQGQTVMAQPGQPKMDFAAPRMATSSTTPVEQSRVDFQGPQCWRCGQYGHLKRWCRVWLDNKKQLN